MENVITELLSYKISSTLDGYVLVNLITQDENMVKLICSKNRQVPEIKKFIYDYVVSNKFNKPEIIEFVVLEDIIIPAIGIINNLYIEQYEKIKLLEDTKEVLKRDGFIDSDKIKELLEHRSIEYNIVEQYCKQNECYETYFIYTIEDIKGVYFIHHTKYSNKEDFDILVDRFYTAKRIIKEINEYEEIK